MCSYAYSQFLWEIFCCVYNSIICHWDLIGRYLHGKSHGQRSLAGYSPCVLTEWYTTKHACMHTHFFNIHYYKFSNNLLKTFREGYGTPLQYSCLENPMDGGAWWATVYGVAKSRTRLSDFTFTFYFHALEKEMATHSSVLTWRIPGTGEPGGLPSMGSHRVRHDWSDLAAAALKTLCVRYW